MNISYINKNFPQQQPEKYYGNREYKRNILCNNNNIIQKRATQMLFRLLEGNGKALYLLGLDDDGKIIGLNKNELNISINIIKNISKEIKAKINKIYIYSGGKGSVCSVHINLPQNLLKNIQDSFLIN